MDNDERYAMLSAEDRERKEEYIKNNPDFEPDGDFWDAHSCSRYADSDGYCMRCGAIVRGSLADYREHGYDPPEDIEY